MAAKKFIQKKDLTNDWVSKQELAAGMRSLIANSEDSGSDMAHQGLVKLYRRTKEVR